MRWFSACSYMRWERMVAMNPLNYTSLEASKKLVENGVRLKTDFYWYKPEFCNYWRIVSRDIIPPHQIANRDMCYPAPSMSELWRELPEWTEDEDGWLEITKDKGNISAGYRSLSSQSNPFFQSNNPADALAELLTWLKKEGKYEPRRT
jgi:hypothetical protein